MIAKITEPSRVQLSVASVAHSVSGTSTMIVPLCSVAARLRTCAVGASSPASLVKRRTRLRDVHAAQTCPHLAVPLTHKRAISEHPTDLERQLTVTRRPNRS